MFDITKQTIDWGGRELTLETGRIARQADGAVLATYGESVVLATVVGSRNVKPGQDFFPLTVHYVEKSYAVGRIPGGFFKREGRPSEKETLTSRLIDRPIRPLFIEDFLNEVQVICQVLSHDGQNDPDILAMIAASAALTISGLPFLGPIGAARVGLSDGAFVLNPTTPQEGQDRPLDLVVAGTRDGVLMVESEAQELSEEQMLDAVTFGHQAFQPVIDMIITMAEHCAKDAWDIPQKPEWFAQAQEDIRKAAAERIAEAYKIRDKQERRNVLVTISDEARADYAEEQHPLIDKIIKALEAEVVRGTILKGETRIDGRTTRDIRPIDTQIRVLPRTHGSALFTRGETQALVTTTLGTAQDEQIIDALTGEYRENFLLHYNFPPFSVGETGRIGTPGRREIGHGKLAWRALRPLLPTKEQFGYSIRLVSEITESNGSSSMATVCGGSLSMMDAGVPLPRPVAGIAMGLIKEDEDFAVLSDILGDEDHLGDMDFKVAGTQEGITALQMDIKITSITPQIMQAALAQAKEGRIHILGEMAKTITNARHTMSDYAPRMESLKINKDKIREVIGSGGKVIREIVDVSGAKVDIDDDGTITIAATSAEAIEKAKQMITDIAAEPEIGAIYHGKVVRTVDFGAFVNFMGPKDGLVHISQLAEHRVKQTTDIVKEGDMVWVKCIGFEGGGKIRLSMKAVDQETGKEIEGSD